MSPVETAKRIARETPNAAVVTGPLCDLLPSGDDPGAPALLTDEPADVALQWIPVVTTFEAAVRASGLAGYLRRADGVTILDASDPRRLKPVAFFTAGSGTRTHHLQVAGDVMLLANGANIVSMLRAEKDWIVTLGHGTRLARSHRRPRARLRTPGTVAVPHRGSP